MKAAPFYQRITAKGVDFFLVLYVSRSEHAFWIIISIIYLLMCDGFFQGQSLGKRIVGLKTMYLEPTNKEYLTCTFFQSAIRNCMFAAVLLLSIIPFIGVVFSILGCVVVFVEMYFMYSDPEGMRIGDIYAKTKVFQAVVS
jgi:uncharacterized RDD family membrane protein YckC